MMTAGLFHTTDSNAVMNQQLLLETKHRLEEIYDMFITSKAKLEICGDNNNVIARENALKMQSTAIDLFIAFKTMNHHH